MLWKKYLINSILFTIINYICLISASVLTTIIIIYDSSHSSDDLYNYLNIIFYIADIIFIGISLLLIYYNIHYIYNGFIYINEFIYDSEFY